MASSKPKAAPARFEGFADAHATFFKRLAKNQTKAWFDAHKAEYEEGWQRPMQALLAEVRAGIDKTYRHAELDEPHVMRIHRDVRFSADKSPYKLAIAGGVPLATGSGKSRMTVAPVALYLQVGAKELMAGAGLYMMDPAMLQRFRSALLDDKRGKELDTIAAKLTKKGYAFSAAETLKKPPKGVDVAHPRAGMLRRKGLVAIYPTIPRDVLASRDLVGILVKASREVTPLVEWLRFATA